MNASFGYATKPDSRQVLTHVRRPNVMLDLEGVYLERLPAKKNKGSGLASNVTVRIKEITGLLNDNHLQTVKEKHVHVVTAFDKWNEAHFDYWSKVKDADGITECCDYLSRHLDNFGAFWHQVDDWIVVAEQRLFSAGLQADSKIKPEDSASSISSHAHSGTLKHSKSSRRVSSCQSRTNSVKAARLEEAVRFAELDAKKVVLRKQQVLGEKKFCLSQEACSNLPKVQPRGRL